MSENKIEGEIVSKSVRTKLSNLKSEALNVGFQSGLPSYKPNIQIFKVDQNRIFSTVFKAIFITPMWVG